MARRSTWIHWDRCTSRLGPIGEQATAMANTLATQNAQLKLEAARFKRKWKDALSMMAKVSARASCSETRPYSEPEGAGAGAQEQRELHTHQVGRPV